MVLETTTPSPNEDYKEDIKKGSNSGEEGVAPPAIETMAPVAGSLTPTVSYRQDREALKREQLEPARDVVGDCRFLRRMYTVECKDRRR